MGVFSSTKQLKGRPGLEYSDAGLQKNIIFSMQITLLNAIVYTPICMTKRILLKLISNCGHKTLFYTNILFLLMEQKAKESVLFIFLVKYW